MRKTMKLVPVVILGITATGWSRQAAPPQPPPAPKGVYLRDLTSSEARRALDPAALVIIPVAAGAIAHGPQLKLGTDDRIVRYLAARVAGISSVVIAPPLTYHVYARSADDPGSTTLTVPTARDTTIEVIRSLARSGPRRFYVLNISPGPVATLNEAARLLANDAILVRQSAVPIRSDGEEAEAAMVQYIDAVVANPRLAASDAPVTPQERGRGLVETTIASIVDEIEKMRTAQLPRIASGGPAVSAMPFRGQTSGDCTEQDTRAIRVLGPAFSLAWSNMDAEAIREMFLDDPQDPPDVRHPDGTIEKGRDTIRDNRRDLFRRREYAHSRHTLDLMDVRCLTRTLALVDGKWELRGVTDAQGAEQARLAGWCTLVTSKVGDAWKIIAWRYTVSPPPNAPPGPTILKQPGWPKGPGGH